MTGRASPRAGGRLRARVWASTSRRARSIRRAREAGRRRGGLRRRRSGLSELGLLRSCAAPAPGGVVRALGLLIEPNERDACPEQDDAGQATGAQAVLLVEHAVVVEHDR